MKIADAEVSQIATGGVLFTFSSHILSEFERSLVVEICERFSKAGTDMLTSAEEWCAFREAVRAMAAHAAPGFALSVSTYSPSLLAPCPPQPKGGRP